MNTVIFILVLIMPPTGDISVVARYDTKDHCMAARREAMDNSQFQASCVPVTKSGMLP